MLAGDMYGKCTSSLREFVGAAGFGDVVIGISGGIDSALVATMAVDALDSSHVHGVMLPGPFSNASSMVDAEELAQNLGIELITIPINEVFEKISQEFFASTECELGGIAAENTQARCRMVFLMALSNSFGWLMLNTGNKSEAAMGYSTLYGDTAGAFAPIGGIYKTDVFALANWRNENACAGKVIAPIPQSIIDKPPSAELSPGQTDEASLGITYEALDRILICANEHGEPIDAIEARGFDRRQIEDVLGRYRRFGFKRELEPPYPDVRFY